MKLGGWCFFVIALTLLAVSYTHLDVYKRQDPKSFLQLKNTHYYHLSDNNGKKDQHLSLGKGTLDLDLISGIERGIIELNNYDNVIKSRNVLYENFDKSTASMHLKKDL